jgi:hypothetical protein
VHSPSFELPRLRTLAAHAVPHLVEASLIPMALFYSAMWLFGIWGALLAALGYCYLALARRIVLRQRIPGLLLLGAAGMTARTILAFASGSVVVYFLQPTLTTVAIAGAFLFSVPAGKPLAEKLAMDFFPLPAELRERSCIRQVFARISLLWAAVNLVNASFTIWFLFTQPVEGYLAMKTVFSLGLLVTGVVISVLWFKRALRRHDVEPAAVQLALA